MEFVLKPRVMTFNGLQSTALHLEATAPTISGHYTAHTSSLNSSSKYFNVCNFHSESKRWCFIFHNRYFMSLRTHYKTGCLRILKKRRLHNQKPSDTHHVGSDGKEEERDCGKYNYRDIWWWHHLYATERKDKAQRMLSVSSAFNLLTFIL